MKDIFVNFIIKIKEFRKNDFTIVNEYLVSYKDNIDDEKDKFAIMIAESKHGKLSISQELCYLKDAIYPARYDINLNLDFDSFITNPSVDEFGERMMGIINNAKYECQYIKDILDFAISKKLNPIEIKETIFDIKFLGFLDTVKKYRKCSLNNRLRLVSIIEEKINSDNLIVDEFLDSILKIINKENEN